MALPNFHLPEEILGHIVQYFDPRSFKDLQVLARLSQVSKQLQRLTEPSLYRSFPGHRYANARLWLNAILARPERAALVRHITVHEFVHWRSDASKDTLEEKENDSAEDGSEKAEDVSDEDDSEEKDYDQLTPREILLSSEEANAGRLDQESLPMLQQLIEDAKMKPGIRGQLRSAFEASVQRPGSTSIDFIMSLIVLACPDLDTIDIEICDSIGEALLPLALTSRTGAISEMNLHREGERDKRAISVGALETLALVNVLGRKNVERVRVTNDNLTYIMDAGRQGIFGPWPDMECITLKHCRVTMSALVILLEGCPSLTSLELRIENAVEDFGALVREHGRGLERLVVDADESWLRQLPERAYSMKKGLYGLGDLKELSSLRELEVAPWCLLSPGNTPRLIPSTKFIDHLPRSLQSLTILPCGEMEGSKQMAGLEEEVELLRQDPTFADLKVCVQR